MFEDKRLGVPTRVGVLQEAFARVSVVLCGLFCLLLYFVLLAQSSLPLDASYPSGQTFVPPVFRLCFKASLRPSEFLFRASKNPTRYKEQMFLRLS